MFNIFSKKKGKKAEKPRVKHAQGKSAKPKGGKKAGAKAQTKAGPKDKPSPDQVTARHKSQGNLLADIPSAPKHRKISLDAGKALEAAKAALQSNDAANLTHTDRKILIAQALAVHSVQSRLLDDLDPEIKQRLRTLAMQKLILDKIK